MSKGNVLLINEITNNLQHFVSKEIYETIIEGNQQITVASKASTVASWVQGTMERLDQFVDEETRTQIMRNCGHKCALGHRREVEKIRASRRKNKTEEEFLHELQTDPPPGVRYERDGNILYQIYMPHSHNLQCYCPLLRGLKSDEKISPTYCQCSQGYVATSWEIILERQVRVELIESCVSGSNECKFAIYIQVSDEVGMK